MVAEQVMLAGQQARETAKQGNVMMLFTVVTVVFVCHPVSILKARMLTTAVASLVLYDVVLHHRA